VTGRFLERDPLGYAEGANAYCYTSSSPVIHADPAGLEKLSAELGRDIADREKHAKGLEERKQELDRSSRAFAERSSP